MMTVRKAQPTHRTPYAFILWGDKFEERVATIFATEFREMGICVKIIGLTGLQAAGVNGLILTADLTLGEALPLADKAICVVAPCSAITLHQIEDDPRVPQFFEQALANHAHCIVSHSNVIAQTSLKTWATPTTQFSIYTESNDLIGLAHAIAVSLFNRTDRAL